MSVHILFCICNLWPVPRLWQHWLFRTAPVPTLMFQFVVHGQLVTRPADFNDGWVGSFLLLPIMLTENKFSCVRYFSTVITNPPFYDINYYTIWFSCSLFSWPKILFVWCYVRSIAWLLTPLMNGLLQLDPPIKPLNYLIYAKSVPHSTPLIVISKDLLRHTTLLMGNKCLVIAVNYWASIIFVLLWL